MADKANAQPGFEEIARLQAELESALARESASQETRRALLAMLEDLEESQREVEQARREWLDAMDAVQDPIFMHDREYRVLRANRAYAERAGMDVRQVVGKPYWQLFPKLDGPLPSCIRALEQRQSDEEELRLPSGEAFLSRHYPILDGEGDCLYSLHIMQDMTEKRRAEAEQRTLSEALRQGEQRFRNLVEASSDWIWEVDAHGIYTYASPKVLDILGYTPDEVIGKTPFDLMPPEEAERIKADFSRLVSEKRSIHMRENVNRHKDGRLVVLETNGVPILDAEGALRGYRGMDRDITMRKQAEARLRLFHDLLDQSTDGIFIVDPATSRFLDVNEAACRDLHYTREELLQRGVVDIQTDLRDIAAWQAHVQELRAQGRNLLEFEALRKDGSRFPVEVSIRDVSVEDQAYIIAVVRDITGKAIRAGVATRPARSAGTERLQCDPGPHHRGKASAGRDVPHRHRGGRLPPRLDRLCRA